MEYVKVPALVIKNAIRELEEYAYQNDIEISALQSLKHIYEEHNQSFKRTAEKAPPPLNSALSGAYRES